MMSKTSISTWCCLASSWIAEQLTRHPLLLDELLDPRSLYTPMERETLEEELSVLFQDVEADETTGGEARSERAGVLEEVITTGTRSMRPPATAGTSTTRITSARSANSP